jgi:hypothetical protein
MTVLTFPTNPINGQRYSAPNGIQYVYDGVLTLANVQSLYATYKTRFGYL